MVAGEVIAVVVPIAFFIMVVAIVALSMYFRTQKLRFSSGGDYRRLAEEAVNGQRVLLEEVQRMNQTLKEIERLLREV